MKINEKLNLKEKEYDHILKNHVYLTHYELVQRITKGYIENKHIPAGITDIATVFHSEEMAEEAINECMEANKDMIKEWLEYRTEKRLLIKKTFLKDIGWGIAKSTNFNTHYPMYCCVVILQLGYNGGNFEVITGFPSPNAGIQMKIRRDKKKFFEENKQKRQKKIFTSQNLL